MSFFESPPKPATALGYHRILSPTASVKVSPICLGGISLGSSWSEIYGENEDAFKLLDAFRDLGGNFIDTSNVYCSERSEELIGEWMEARNVRDEMVIATKYTAGYKKHDQENIKFQSNYIGNSAKSMFVSVRDSLKKLRTDYIDILYVHWWDHGTSVEEIMRHLHNYVVAKQVLYLGASDIPAWIVVKANEFARHNGLTPFSVYQGRWNAAFRDLEAEIIPMCEDQGMAVVPWSALGGGSLVTEEERDKIAQDPTKRQTSSQTPADIKVSEVLEKIANSKGTTFQAVTLAYLFSQSTYVFPIVGVNTVAHVKAMPTAVTTQLSQEEIRQIQEASQFTPLFPVDFLFNHKGNQPYHTGLTASNNQQYQMAAWIQAPPRQQPYDPGFFERGGQ